jgi:prevent-host-death family protein
MAKRTEWRFSESFTSCVRVHTLKKKEYPTKTLPLTKAKVDLSSVIRDAEKEEVLITRHGRPAALVIGFADEDDWLEYRLLHDEKFLRSVERIWENGAGRSVSASSP